MEVKVVSEKLVLVMHKVYCTHCKTWSRSNEGVKLFQQTDVGGKFLRLAKESEIQSDLPRETLIVTRDINRCDLCWQEHRFVMPPRAPAPSKPEKAKIDISDLGV